MRNTHTCLNHQIKAQFVNCLNHVLYQGRESLEKTKLKESNQIHIQSRTSQVIILVRVKQTCYLSLLKDILIIYKKYLVHEASTNAGVKKDQCRSHTHTHTRTHVYTMIDQKYQSILIPKISKNNKKNHIPLYLGSTERNMNLTLLTRTIP